jgi:hypothetical protein
MKFGKTFAAAALLCVSALSASAATVSIDFEGVQSVPDYAEDGFVVSALQTSSWQNGDCFSGSCIQDANNGLIAEIHHSMNEAFKLVSFYFYLNGVGSGGTDDLGTVCSKNCVNVYDTSDPIANLLASFVVRKAVPAGTSVEETNGDPVSTVVHNTKYIATFDTPVDIASSLSFYTFFNANVRIDAVTLISQDHDPVVPSVPVPAAGLMGLAGLGALATLRRKKRLA